MLCHSSALWEAAPTELPGSIVSGVSVIICFASLIVLPRSLVMKDPMEVCPLSREGMVLLFAHPLSVPLQSGVGFFHHPLPAPPSKSLAKLLPPLGRRTGLPRFAHMPERVRSCFIRRWVGVSATGEDSTPVPPTLPFGSSLSAPLTCFS